MDSTTVVCLKRDKDKIIQDCDIYIGRQVPRGGWGFGKSMFANPYIVGSSFVAKHSGEHISVNTVKDSMTYYWNMLVQGKVDVKSFDEILLMRKALSSLKGKRLGCFCKRKGEMCHGDILAFLCDNWDGKVDDKGRMILDVDLEKVLFRKIFTD